MTSRLQSRVKRLERKKGTEETGAVLIQERIVEGRAEATEPLYTDTRTGEVMTLQQFREKHPGWRTIIILPANGRD